MSCQLIETANAAAKAVAPGAALPEPARAALMTALEDERGAQALCAARVGQFGAVAPFASHLKAKKRRVAALATLAKAYGAMLPKAPGSADEALADTQVESFEAACAAGIAAETARVARYDATLIPAAAGVPGLAALFSALRDRSWNKHLPALRRGTEAGSSVPDLRGSNGGRGNGHGHENGGGCGHRHGHGHDHRHQHAEGH